MGMLRSPPILRYKAPEIPAQKRISLWQVKGGRDGGILVGGSGEVDVGTEVEAGDM